jgi:hypothetical protein
MLEPSGPQPHEVTAGTAMMLPATVAPRTPDVPASVMTVTIVRSDVRVRRALVATVALRSVQGPGTSVPTRAVARTRARVVRHVRVSDTKAIRAIAARAARETEKRVPTRAVARTRARVVRHVRVSDTKAIRAIAARACLLATLIRVRVAVPRTPAAMDVRYES